jgi:hypothetical protein
VSGADPKGLRTLKNAAFNWKYTIPLTFIGLTMLAGGFAATANAETFYIIGSEDSDTIFFQSEPELHAVEGFSHTIKGLMTFNPDSTYELNAGILKVRGASVSAGVEPRDQQERANDLGPPERHFVELKLISISGLPDILPFDSPVECQLHGSFTVDSVDTPITVPAEVRLLERNESDRIQIVEVRAEFELVPDDFDIPVSEALFLKVAEQLKVRMQFVALNVFPPLWF